MPDVGQDAGGFASAAASNYGAGLRMVQALREAAAQQQQRQQQQELESFKNQLEILKAGGVPEMSQTGGTIASGGLGQRQPNPNADPNGTFVTEPISGKRYVVPKKKEKEENPDDYLTISGGPLLQSLQEAGADVSSGHVRVKSDAASLHELLNSAADKNPLYVHTTDAEGNERILERDRKTGQWTQAGYFPAVGKPSPEKKPQVTRHMDLEHFSRPMMFEEGEDGKVKATPIELPAGIKRTLTPGQEETKRRADEREQDKKDEEARKRGEATQKAVLALNTKEQEQHERRSKYGDILSQIGEVKPGASGSIIDPDTKKAVAINDATRETRRKYYQNLYQKATDMVGVYQSQQRQLLGQGDQSQAAGRAPAEPAASTTTAAPTRRSQYNPGPGTRTPATPAEGHQITGAGTKGKKTATPAHVRAYAKQKGISEYEAVKEFMQSGYTLTQGQ